MTEERETRTGDDFSLVRKPTIVIKRKAVVLIALFLLSVIAVTGTIMFTIFYLNFNLTPNP